MSEPVRTAKLPMAFTADEFCRGAWMAWGAVMAILAIGAIVLSAGMGAAAWAAALPALVLLGAIAGAVVVLFSPVAWWVARLLRRDPRIAVHLVAFIGLGALVGVALVLLISWLFGRPPSALLGEGWGWFFITASSLAVLTGWTYAALRSLRAALRVGEGESRP